MTSWQRHARLGVLLKDGIGVEKDLARAHELLDLSCRNHDPIGCLNLGQMYKKGLGVTEDARQGTAMLQWACLDHSKDACYALAKDGVRL